MTDTTPAPDDARDELVSAVLDGEADAGERARVEADPELRARLEELRAVRDAVAAPVEPLDEVTALRLRRTAAATAPVARPAEPSRGARAAKWIGSVAAIVLLAAAAIPVLGSLDGGGSGDDEASSDMMSSADSDEAEEEGAVGLDSAESGQADAAGDEMSSEETSRGSAVVDLGQFVSDQALARSALLERTTDFGTGSDDADDAGGESETAPAPDQIQNALDACDPPSGLAVTEVLLGQVDGTPRLVWIVELDDATTGVRVLDVDTCVVLAQAP